MSVREASAVAGGAVRRLATLLACLALAVGVAACGGGGSGGPAPPSQAAGEQIDNTLPAAVSDAVLEATSGQRVSLAQFAGKVVVLSDFMSLCQESCPLDTANVVAAARAVQRAGLGDKVEFVSLTIDPARDTLAQLQAFKQLYAPAPADWMVATSSAAILGRLWKALGVFIQKTKDSPPLPRNWRTGAPLSYDLTHADDVFFLDPNGHERFLLTGVPHVAPGAPIPAALMKFMDAQGHQNLTHPGPDPWTEPEELQAISWLTGHRIPAATS